MTLRSSSVSWIWGTSSEDGPCSSRQTSSLRSWGQTVNRCLSIVHFLGKPRSGGLFLRTIQQCAERGWSTHVVWTDRPADPVLAKSFMDAGCEINVLPRPRGNFDLRCVLRTFRLLRHVRCDLFHCLNIHTSPLIAAALARVPVRIWSKYSMSPYYERDETPAGLHRLHVSTRLSCRLAHRVLPISETVRDELVTHGAPASKLIVAPGPIALERIATASMNGVRAGVGLQSSHLVITTVGHAVPVKGWDVLLEAFASLAKHVPQARLLLVGSTADPHEVETACELRALASNLGISAVVYFLGRRNDIPQILATSDIFVLPSRSEGQPFALKEALAAGVPCIATRVGGIAEVITHNRNGLLFDRDDISQLAVCLRALLDNPDVRKKLGAQGRASVQRFDMGEATNKMLDLYETLLAQSGVL